ncbi:CPCC family cysteine-rich protein [Pseudomonas piscis]|uniref:CPCC family cysteine-rich protein n=1 Tax=Pseudomonas piscis TaxID=2614538 RepID=UPI0039A50D81
MKPLTRPAAIDRLSRHRLLALSAQERADHLLNVWTLAPEAPEFATLSASLGEEMQTREPPENAESARYDALILVSLRAAYHGVSNPYLSRCLAEAGYPRQPVEGPVETLLACPCCGYLTLGAHGEYEICGLCHWEDDGCQALDVLSGPNHKTLAQAREHFAQIQGSLPLDKWPPIIKDHP